MVLPMRPGVKGGSNTGRVQRSDFVGQAIAVCRLPVRRPKQATEKRSPALLACQAAWSFLILWDAEPGGSYEIGRNAHAGDWRLRCGDRRVPDSSPSRAEIGPGSASRPGLA